MNCGEDTVAGGNTGMMSAEKGEKTVTFKAEEDDMSG